MRWRVRVEGLLEDGLATGGGRLRARWIIGADGLHSQVRRWAGLAARPGRHRRYGVRRHYRMAPWSREVEVHWSDDAEAYVTPVAADEVGVALLWRGAAAGFDPLLDRFPRLRERLAGVARSSRDRGAGPFHQRVRGLFRGRVVLVGDASGYLDPVTGEGLGIAFRQAIALGEALQAGNLRSYATAHRRLVRGPARLTALLLQVERRPWLRRRVIRALADDPDLFSRLLGDLVSGRNPLAPGSSLPWRLARRLVMRPETLL
jgi:flavin-dependent dehydrogenase